MDYNGYVLALSTMMGEQDSGNPDFQAILPSIISLAEGRMYRDLDMLGTKFTATGALTANSRFFSLPSQTLVLDGINVIDFSGNRNQLVPTTREFLDFAWPNPINTQMPIYFAPTSQLQIALGPWPDQPYQAEVVGVATQVPLNLAPPPPPGTSGTQTTILTTYLPDAFLACSMIYATAYQKNFGQQSDDPQLAQSWESQYGSLMKSAATYEMRKKFQSEAWSSQQPNPLVGGMPRA